jgi:hypothetical protein
MVVSAIPMDPVVSPPFKVGLVEFDVFVVLPDVPVLVSLIEVDVWVVELVDVLLVVLVGSGVN